MRTTDADRIAKAIRDENDRARHADALAEARKEMNDGLRGYMKNRDVMSADAKDVTSEQILASDERRKGLDQGARQPAEGARTRADLNDEMNTRLRESLFSRHGED